MSKKWNQMKAFLLVSCMAVSFVMADGSVSGAKSSGAKALQTMGDASEKKIAEQVKVFQKEDALQRDAKDAYDELMDVVEERAAVEKNYAGAYIDDDNQLVVNLTTSSEKVQDIVQEKTESQEVKFEEKDCTYDELIDAYEKIKASIDGTKYFDVDKGLYLDLVNNQVTVEMSDLSYAQDFREDICDAECIDMKKAMGEAETQKTYLKPGGYIDNSSGSYSIGWRGWRINNAGNYTEGFVTAAHGNKVGEIASTSGGHTFGKFVKRRYGGDLDAAFVQNTSKSFGVTNTIKFSGSSLAGGYYMRNTYLHIGDSVYKVGMTTKLTQGKILSLTASGKSSDGNSYSDYVKADYYALGGDSGGLVYMDLNGQYRIAGNHVLGYDSNKPGNSSAWFVKADNIINKMEIYPY